MGAAEHLARLDDALGRAGSHRIDGRAAGPVDAGKAEDGHRRAILCGQAQPAAFGLGAAHGSWDVGVDGRVLVHPAAVAIAIDAGRRQVADPGEVGQRLQVLAVVAQHRVALVVGRRRDQDVGDALQGLGRQGRGAVIDPGGEAGFAQGGDALGRAAGAPDLPPLVPEAVGEDAGREAEAEAEQAGHGRSPQAVTFTPG